MGSDVQPRKRPNLWRVLYNLGCWGTGGFFLAAMAMFAGAIWANDNWSGKWAAEGGLSLVMVIASLILAGTASVRAKKE